MDEARHLLERLDRIEELGRRRAQPAAVLDELRALVREAEAWARREGSAADPAASAIEALRAAVGDAGGSARTPDESRPNGRAPPPAQRS